MQRIKLRQQFIEPEAVKDRGPRVGREHAVPIGEEVHAFLVERLRIEPAHQVDQLLARDRRRVVLHRFEIVEREWSALLRQSPIELHVAKRLRIFERNEVRIAGR